MTASTTDHVRAATQEVGALLGQIIREDDPAAFERIETVRRLAVARHFQGATGELPALLEGLSADAAFKVVHGFACFLQAANAAEDAMQARRASLGEDAIRLDDVLDALAKERVTGDQVRALLGEGLIVPVLTAHPSEVRRRSVLEHAQAMGRPSAPWRIRTAAPTPRRCPRSSCAKRPCSGARASCEASSRPRRTRSTIRSR